MRFNRERFSFVLSSYFLSISFEEAQNMYLDYLDHYPQTIGIDYVYAAIFYRVCELRGIDVDTEKMLLLLGKTGKSSFYRALDRVRRLKAKRFKAGTQPFQLIRDGANGPV